jgi:hypothetical protein
MRHVSRLIAVGALLVQAAVGILSLVVAGSADVVGPFAMLSKDDAVLIFLLFGASLVTTIILAIVSWRTSRTRRRLEVQLAALAPASQQDTPSI